MTTTTTTPGRLLTEVEVGERSLAAFAQVLPAEEYARLEAAAERGRQVFAGRTLWNVNSTARGGGVAEMLLPLLAYARGVGVDARWMVIAGDEAFFRVTKRIHNRLHGVEGDGGPLGPAEREDYERVQRANGDELEPLVGPRDVVILHDPQTAGLVPRLKARGALVVWRCHVGLDTPNDLARQAWAFLAPYARQADVCVFSREAFVWEDLRDECIAVIAPSIDAFAPKNEPLAAEAVDAILVAAGLRAGAADPSAARFTRMDGSPGQVRRRAEMLETAPLQPGDRSVLQVSRWDALKDPLGVIDGFARHVAPHGDGHLIYAGPAVEAVADDPEGAIVLEQARAHWHALPADVRARVHLAMLPMVDLEENAAMVNALQRAADVVVQKSLAEGFGLTVAEAMWKARPVVASRIGGIQDQIEDGRSGILLADPRDLAAYGAAVRRLLDDPATARRMGAAAEARVRERFLGTHSLLDYLELLAPRLS
jgi:trehalose synthase